MKDGGPLVEPVAAGARIPSAESREMAQRHDALSREALSTLKYANIGGQGTAAASQSTPNRGRR